MHQHRFDQSGFFVRGRRVLVAAVVVMAGAGAQQTFATADPPNSGSAAAVVVAADLAAPPACGAVGQALMTIRTIESKSDYTAQSTGSTASGAYQITDSTWMNWSTAAGIGGLYEHAWQAPPAVQDAVAGAQVQHLLEHYHGDVSELPLIWYEPRAILDPTLMDVVPAPQDGNVLTPRQYQTMWMTVYNSKPSVTAGTCAPPTPAAADPLPFLRIDEGPF